jgi:predicted transcriptional regulator
LKSAFKGHLKNEVAEEMSFHMNGEFLFEQQLIGLIYEKVRAEKVKVEFDIDACMRENNNQVNSHCEDINIKKLIAEIHHNVTAGFSSAEANMEYLKEPSKAF